MISLKLPLDQSEHDLARQMSGSIPESEAHVVHLILDLLLMLVVLMAAVAENLEV